MTYARTVCRHCQDKGLLRIHYRSGEPFDVALCHCDRGRKYRRWLPASLRAWLGLPDAHRIGRLEDFEDRPEVPVTEWATGDDL